MSVGELACTYAALILHDDGIAVTAEKISTIVKSAKVNVESYWPSLFAKLCEKKDIEDLITSAGSGSVGGGVAVSVAAPAGEAAAPAASAAAAPAAEAKKEEEEGSDDDDFIPSLFDEDY